MAGPGDALRQTKNQNSSGFVFREWLFPCSWTSVRQVVRMRVIKKIWIYIGVCVCVHVCVCILWPSLYFQFLYLLGYTPVDSTPAAQAAAAALAASVAFFKRRPGRPPRPPPSPRPRGGRLSAQWSSYRVARFLLSCRSSSRQPMGNHL